MEITIAKTEKKEITLPYFFKLTYQSLQDTHYAIFTEDKAMRIDTNKEICCTSPVAIQDHPSGKNFVETTEAEFTEAFEKTMEVLTSMVPVSK